MKQNITVMLVEDHPGYREVIERSIKRETDIEIISQFSTAEIALRSLQSETPPEVILLDLNLPGMSGLEAIPWIIKYAPKTKIVVLSQSDSKTDVLTAIQLNASGYLLKSATAEQISNAIRTVVEQGAPLDPSIAKSVLQTLKSALEKEPIGRELSERETEILQLLSEGFVKKEIAEKLKISIATVAYHVKNIYEKLQVQNAPAAVGKAYKKGIL